MVYGYLDKILTLKQKELINFNSDVFKSLIKAVNNSVINNTYTIGLPYWSAKDPVLVRDFTWLMYNLGLGSTKITRNYASFQLHIGNIASKEEIDAYRKRVKLDRFVMRLDTRKYEPNLVKRNGKICRDGLDRSAMLKTSKNEFSIDTDLLDKYRRPIKKNLVKSIKKMTEKKQISKKFFRDEANYLEVVNICLDYYIANPQAKYNSEINIQDQRGRAIKGVLKRVGNYISSKDFRALLKVPEDKAYILKDDENSLNSIYYFIAELTNHKCIGLTEAIKIMAGKKAYKSRELPKLDLNSNEGLDELHVLIWLERIYSKLDELYMNGSVLWDIPVEIDHSMSLAQIVGALTNDERILKSTSLIGEIISDPWKIDGVKRLTAKTIGTPTFYGSSQSAIALIKAKGLPVDTKEISLVNKEFAKGRFSILKQFKDLMIKNYNIHKPIIDIDTGISKYTIHVNKWKKAGTKIVVTEAFDGKKFRHSFTHIPETVPDYKAMRTFWATNLVHHLDSDLMEYNLKQHSNAWALDIHDAILCLPKDAISFRTSAAKRLKFYNENRFKIIYNYMKSIGAVTPRAQLQYIRLLSNIVDAENVTFSRNCMK